MLFITVTVKQWLLSER